MIRKLVKSLLLPPPTEIQKLLEEAHLYPRYQKHRFTYKGMHFTVTDFISVAYQLKEYFVDERMKFTSDAASPVIIDCGSNVGVSVIYFKNRYPNASILAFEPDAKVASCFKENIRQNNIENIALYEKAVWINNDHIEFGAEGADGGSVFHNGNKIQVPAIRLKEVLEQHTQIDLLKIDIEGAEGKVLQDCADELHKVNHLFLEYHSWKSEKQELDKILSLLTEKGFRYQIHSIGEQIRHPFTDKTSHAMDVQLDIYAINEKQKA